MSANKISGPGLPELPIGQCLDELALALNDGHVTLSAATGSGKTTIVPLALLNHPQLNDKKIIMLEPRRPATRMAAHRMAALLGETVGNTVGYQVRFERKIGRQTRIEVLTEGLLLRRLQKDPELADVGVIIFDEFHERSLVADLSLALCLDVCNSLRDDLRLLVMSASLDEQEISTLLNARAITAEGRSYPVDVHYAGIDHPLNEVVDACLPQLRRACAETTGDVLVFLPGKAEINRLQSLLRSELSDEWQLMLLHGDISSDAQDKVLRPARGGDGKKRIILATDIAETSLTIEGVTAVVDGGRARKPVFHAASGLTRLQTRWISKASALQRTGRAGRLGPGVCYRCWSESRQARLDDWIAAEITNADLAPLVLELANWGVSNAQEMLWLTPPPEAHYQQARQLLLQLDAINETGGISVHGQHMAMLPAHPRIAHMLLLAAEYGHAALAADLAALLTDRDPVLRDQSRALGSDCALRTQAQEFFRQGGKPAGFDLQRLRNLQKLARQFSRLLPAEQSVEQRAEPVSMSVGMCLALAYPDRVAKRRSAAQAVYQMRSGRAARLQDDDPLRSCEYIVAAQLDAGQREGRIWLGAELRLDELTTLFSHQMQARRTVSWDSKRQVVTARHIKQLDSLIISAQVVPLEQADDASAVLLTQLQADGLGVLGDDKVFVSLRQRAHKMHCLFEDEGWPDMTDQGLLQSLEVWLAPWVERCSSYRELKKLDLVAAMQAYIGWDKQQRLNRLLPTHYETPAGTRRVLDYGFTEPPVLRVRLQEMLGVRETPMLADGRLPLLVHLLSPAGRPLQITRDLNAFWHGSYEEVKKEMRGRYPKHYWPDDPASATATRHVKKRM